MLKLHLSPRATLIPHRPNPWSAVHLYPRQLSSIPNLLKVCRPIPSHPQGPHPSPRDVNMPVRGGASSGTTIMHQDRGMIILSHALSSRLIYNHRALHSRPTPPRYSVLQHQAGDPFCSACILATCKPKLCKPMLCSDHILSLAPELSTYG